MSEHRWGTRTGRAAQWPRFAPVVLTACVGMGLSVAISMAARQAERHEVETEFTSDAQDRVGAIADGIQTKMLALEALGAFYEGSREVERAEFHEFLVPVLSRLSGVQALEWIPRVPGAERAEFEAAVRKEGVPGFRITERDAQGQLVAAGPRGEYFPVCFVEPPGGNAVAIGFDMASERVRLDALERSRDTGKIAASGRIRLVQETGHQFGILVFRPVYAKGATVSSVADRRTHLRGFVLGVFRVGDLIEHSVSGLGPRRVCLEVSDESAPENERRLYADHGEAGEAPGRPDIGQDHARPVFHHATTIDVGGRTWRLAYSAPAGYVRAQTTWLPLGALIGGLLFTGLLGVYLLGLMNHAAREATAAAQLAASNQDLQAELAERHRAEAAAKANEMRFRRLFEQANDIVIVHTLDGQILDVNGRGCERLGCDKAALLTRRVYDLHPPEEHREVAAALQTLTETGSVRLDAHCLRADGTTFEVEISSGVVEEGKGIAQAILRDVSERKRAEAERYQSQKLQAIGQLAAGIAHEINTPTQYVGDNVRFLQESFGALTGLLETYGRLLDAVRAGPVPPDLLAEVEAAAREADIPFLSHEIPLAVHQSLDGVDRVATIVRAMKDFAVPGAETMTAVDLGCAIESTVTVSRNAWKYVADLETDFDPDLPPVVCLPGDVNQVILHLIINAAQAIGVALGPGATHKGRITIRTRHDGDRAEIRVSDTGTGIPEAVRDRVFDPFFTTRDVGRGTGQGLAVARAVVVDKHGGSIDFETEVGRGTTFIVRLPLVPQGARQRLAEEVVHAG